MTPDSYQSLLRDLFEKKTFWEFETQRATAQQTEAGVDPRRLLSDLGGDGRQHQGGAVGWGSWPGSGDLIRLAEPAIDTAVSLAK